MGWYIMMARHWADISRHLLKLIKLVAVCVLAESSICRTSVNVYPTQNNIIANCTMNTGELAIRYDDLKTTSLIMTILCTYIYHGRMQIIGI